MIESNLPRGLTKLGDQVFLILIKRHWHVECYFELFVTIYLPHQYVKTNKPGEAS